ncbi:MAG: phosphomannomutase/phosphoglucomutase, partial [Planctomycetes bacterium]|nr:phosphomannomutase/phosphoglucomutase [Planctomycetota bacterium]
MSIFKAYDIRGKYPSELDEPKAEAIGWAIGRFLAGFSHQADTAEHTEVLHTPTCPTAVKRESPLAKPQRSPDNFGDRGDFQEKPLLRGVGVCRIAVGRDVRISSPSLAESLIKGLVLSGVEVTDIGVVTTPMSYFASGFYGFDGSVMVTASHNPAEYNGFKVCRENAIALSEYTGLKEIEKLTNQKPQTAGSETSDKHCSRCKTLDIKPDYKKFISGFIKLRRPLKVVVDTTNGAVGPIFPDIFKSNDINVIPLYFEPDGRFPNHEPNPMKDDNIVEIKRIVVESKADFGVAFDGDGDRCVFIDEQGNRVPNDLITALIARQMLAGEKGASIVYDLRSSWVVKEEIEHYGGRPLRERVGHAFIKSTMRKHNAVFGGELSGHYYFRDNYFADDALLAFCQILNLLAASDTTFSHIVRPLKKYFSSGELNFVVTDKDKKIMEISEAFKDGRPAFSGDSAGAPAIAQATAGRQDFLDGVTVEYKDWWFNVRKSNT